MNYNTSQRYRQKNFIVTLAAAVSSIIWPTKQPCRTSILTGDAYVKELLAETVNRRREFEVLRMPSSSFVQLAKWCVQQGVLCRSRKGVTVEEQLAIFLYIVGHNSSNRDAQERFQHSGETITRYFQRCYRTWAKTVDSSVLICCRYYYRYFNAVLRTMLHLYGKEVRLSLNEAPIPPI
jgi:hypothetical protein